MRSKANDNGVTAILVAGTGVVMIAIDIEEALRPGLLGFAIWRADEGSDSFVSLTGGRVFASADPSRAVGVPLEQAPVQDFLWSDYEVEAGKVYTYRVAPVTGTPAALVTGAGVDVTVRTETNDGQTHAVWFNRGAAGSQAFSREFGAYARDYRVQTHGEERWQRFTRPADVPDGRAYTWLSRGLGEAMEAFIRQAVRDPGAGENEPRYQLRAALYEFSYRPMVRAFVDALESGTDVKIVHHVHYERRTALKKNAQAVTETRFTDPAKPPVVFKASEVEISREPEGITEAAVDTVFASVGVRNPAHRQALEAMMIPRTNSNIQHNKFIVLLKDDKPVAVWTGSTNLTAGGIYGQSNLGHAVYDPQIAQAYLDYWEVLARDPAKRPGRGTDAGQSMTEWVAAQRHDPVGLPEPGSSMVIFSPRPTTGVLEWYAERFAQARQSVHFTTAFTVADQILARSIVPPPQGMLRYLLMETIGGKMRSAYNQMKTIPHNRIAWGATLGTVEAGDTGDLEETLTGLNTNVNFLHTKYMLVDALTDNPLVISGSANFSKASTVDNDENMLVITGDLRLADIFVTEFMRTFRHFQNRNERGSGPNAKPRPVLAESDVWQEPFFTPGSPEYDQRRLHAGTYVPPS
jgi:phosphatidylserine/phosphatidylglycerophosphate/cardiolipin synthase-like enzyme